MFGNGESLALLIALCGVLTSTFVSASSFQSQLEEMLSNRNRTFWEHRKRFFSKGSLNRTKRQVEEPKCYCGVPVDDTPEKAHPWMVAIYHNSNGFTCHGAILNDHFVVTDVMSLQVGQPEDYYGVIGSHLIVAQPPPGTKITFVQKIQHPAVLSFGVLKTSSLIIFSATIKPICIPPAEPIVCNGEEVLIPFWTGVGQDPPVDGTELGTWSVPAISAATCVAQPDFFCAKTDASHEPCHGYQMGAPTEFKVDGVTYDVGHLAQGDFCDFKKGFFINYRVLRIWLLDYLAIDCVPDCTDPI